MKRPEGFRDVALGDLTIEDERSFRHVELYDELKRALGASGYRFRVPASMGATPPNPRDSASRVPASMGATPPNVSWDRALFLNLTFWSGDEQGDVLTSNRIAADVVVHVAWHHLTRRALGDAAGTASGLFLGEAIASASDLYLVGRLLGHAPESEFLATQVPAMAEVAESNGLDEGGFEALLEEVAAAPERAFEDLRALLFDTSMSLLGCRSVDDAWRALDAFGDHRFASLLHHYELSNWVLFARAHATDHAPYAVCPAVSGIDASLRAAPDPLAWLTGSWLPHADLDRG